MTEKTPSLNAALTKVQAELPKLERDRTVIVEPKDPKKDTYSYSYATLANVSEAILPLLAKHGLAFTALPGTGSDGKMCLRYALLHESGEEKGGEFPISGEGGIQMIGGRITYARRYCLQSVVGLVADEDDEARLADDGPARSTAQRAVRAPRHPESARPPAANAPAAKTAQRANAAPAGPPLPGEEGNAITKPQMAKMQALFAEADITTPEEKRDYCTQQLGRTITSVGQLSLQDARKVIDALAIPGDPPRDDEGWLIEEPPEGVGIPRD